MFNVHSLFYFCFTKPIQSAIDLTSIRSSRSNTRLKLASSSNIILSYPTSPSKVDPIALSVVSASASTSSISAMMLTILCSSSGSSMGIPKHSQDAVWSFVKDRLTAIPAARPFLRFLQIMVAMQVNKARSGQSAPYPYSNWSHAIKERSTFVLREVRLASPTKVLDLDLR